MRRIQSILCVAANTWRGMDTLECWPKRSNDNRCGGRIQCLRNMRGHPEMACRRADVQALTARVAPRAAKAYRLTPFPFVNLA
jgi:hypothetical protein